MNVHGHGSSRGAAFLLLLGVIFAPAGYFFGTFVLDPGAPAFISASPLPPAALAPPKTASPPPPRLASDPAPLPGTLVIGDGGAPLPSGGFVTGGEAAVCWFLTITDTQDCWADPAKVALLRSFLNETVGTIQPVFTINTGDLVQGDTPLFTRAAGQLPSEWQAYNATIAATGLIASTYFDVLGNHDAYGDPARAFYLNYSVSGSSFGATQFAVDLRLPWGDYAFDFLATPEEHGLEFPFSYGGHLTPGALEWLEGQLVAQAGSNLTFTFGHHGPLAAGFERAASGRTFLGLLRDHAVSYYGHGHDDISAYQAVGSTAALETAQFSVAGGTYRITAVDNDRVASTVAHVGAWPAGIITSPTAPDFTLGAFNFTAHQAADTIRCLAWDPAGVASVTWRATYPNGTTTAWAPLANAAGPLWSASLGGVLAGGQTTTLEVNITSASGASTVETIAYSPGPTWHFGGVEGTYLLVVMLAAVVVVVPVTRHWISRHNGRPRKEPGQQVDPVLRGTWIVKLLAFLVLPLTAGLMWAGEVTWAFSWGLAGAGGVAWSDVVLWIGGVVAIPLVAQVCNLSPCNARPMRALSITSILLMGGLLAFYLALYPTTAWVAPGTYLAIAADVIMARRANLLTWKKDITALPHVVGRGVTFAV